MLGLRKIPEGLRKHASRPFSSSKKSTESLSSDAGMAVLANGSSAPPSVPGSKSAVETNVTEIDISDSHSEKSDRHVDSLTVVQPMVPSPRHTRVVRVYQDVCVLRKRMIHEVEEIDETYFDYVNLQTYLSYIAEERLIHMPKRGSSWDRVLREAEYFGLQIDEFSYAVDSFVDESVTIRNTALASCFALLELGSEQSEALEPTFNVLFEIGHLLGHLIRLQDLFTLNDNTTLSLGDLFSSLLSLVSTIAVEYRRRINRLSGSSVSIDFNREFGDLVQIIFDKRARLFEHMWSHALSSTTASASLDSLHRHLSSHRSSSRSVIYGRVASHKQRAHGTCDWIERDLIDFLESDKKVLSTTADAGYGKSFLASWTRERLERPIGHVREQRLKFETVSFTFASDNAGESTTLAFLKSLLAQMLDLNVGDRNLFNKSEHAFTTFEASSNVQKLQRDLWAAFETGLDTINHRQVPFIIIVDGLDDMVGGDAKASVLYEKLCQVVGKFAFTRLLSFSKPASYISKPGSVIQLKITNDYIREDIKTYLRTTLHTSKTWRGLEHVRQEEMIDIVASRTKESFLLAYLFSRLLFAGCEIEVLYKSLKNGSLNPLQELVKHLDVKNATVQRFLAFILAAERPLSAGEMEDLLSVDVARRTITSGVSVQDLLDKTLGLVTLQDGKLRFKHSIIRTYLTGLCGQTLLSIKEANKQLATSLLLFAKLKFTRSLDVTLDASDSKTIHDTLHSCHIAEYIVRYWTLHVRQSTLVDAKGELALTQEFKDVFPGSTLMAILEWTSWSRHSVPATSIIEMHEWSLRVRSACFGEKHKSVLQTLFILGSLHRGHSDLTKACEYYYRASTIGQAILFKFSPIVVSCTNIFLVCSETIVFTKRTVIVTYREEMIRFMITVCKGQHGPHSDVVIRWYEALAKLYIDIHEEHLAVTIYKELREIIIIRFGPGGKKLGHLDEALAGLDIVLKKQGGCGDIVEVEDLFFDSVESRDSTDELRITILLRLAKVYESEGKFFFAERLYISLWRTISAECRHKATIELRFTQINIALEYVYFLKRLGRHEEACNILICIWAEYEHQHFEEMTIIIRLKEIAVLFRSFGLLTTAISILKRVWFWFQEKKLTEHEEASSTTVIITEVVEEITETITETTTTTTVTETLTREIFETTYTRCKKEKVDHHFFKACMSLVNLYIKLEQWSEVEIVVRKSLELVWKNILTINEKIVLEGSFISERILIATRLASCYHHQRLFEKAEQLYLRIWRACLTLHAEDICLVQATTTIILFYEEYHRHEKVIDICVELLKHYRKHLGASHKLTISILYKLAGVYTLLGRAEAYDCYIEIVKIYTKDGCCHHDGFQAATILLHFYHHHKRWAELENLCVLLWSTIIDHHHEWTYTEEFVQLVWTRYRYVLEFHRKVEFSVLYKLTIQYREVVKKIFSITAALFLEAMLALAELCETREEHCHESVTIYEEIITKKTTVTTVTETKIRTIKKRLSRLYVTIITTNGKKTETTTVERAIALCLEVYEHLKLELGWYHETTLLKLKELVVLYSVSGDKHRGTILSLLQASVLHIITHVKVSRTLYDAALRLSGIYLHLGLQLQGQELLRQLRYLILFPGFDAADQNITIKLDVAITKVALVFLIAFDEGLVVHSKDAVCSFSTIMGDLLMETLLYEQYISVITTITETTSIEIVLEHAARLRCIWDSRGRKGFVEVLDKKLFALFVARYAKHLGQYSGDKFVFNLYVSIIYQIGEGSFADRTTIDFALLTCKAVNTAVRKLLVEKNDLVGANSVARCGFQLANSQGFYNKKHCFVYGYRLADLLAGHGVPSWDTADAKQKDALRTTSREILQSVLGAMKKAGIDLLSLRFEDLSRLIHLLREQQNYLELETLLTSLWRSREVQRSWSADTVLHIGQLLVEAHVGALHTDRAVDLCDTLFYNLRQSRGGTDPQALYFARRLADLLRATGRARQAARVHEDVLHDLDEHRGTGTGNGNDNRQVDLRAAADRHLEGVRTCGFAATQQQQQQQQQQQNGGGHRRRSFTDLYARLGSKFGKLSMPPPDKWTTTTSMEKQHEDHKAEISVLGGIEWMLTMPSEDDNNTSGGSKEGRKVRKRDSVLPAQERWGCGLRTAVY